jgi:hypothetical protein
VTAACVLLILSGAYGAFVAVGIDPAGGGLLLSLALLGLAAGSIYAAVRCLKLIERARILGIFFAGAGIAAEIGVSVKVGVPEGLPILFDIYVIWTLVSHRAAFHAD